MIAPLRIGIAEDELDTREFYQIVIPEMGHRLLWAARNGAELLDLAWQSPPDLLIVDVKMPLLDGLDAVRSLSRDHPVLVIVVSGHHDPQTMERAENEQLMAYLIKPIREADLKAAILIASKRFNELQSMREATARQSAHEAKVRQHVLDAIGLLMTSGDLSRQEAFQRLRDIATKERRSLLEVSRTLIDSVDGTTAKH